MLKLRTLWIVGFMYIPLLGLQACGPGESSSDSAPIRDSVSTTAAISFIESGQKIKVESRGDDPASKLIPICNFTVSQFQDILTYKLVSTDSLQLGDNTFTYQGPLPSQKSLTGVPDRLFSIWAAPSTTRDGVQLDFTIAIEPKLLTFTLACTQ